MLTFLQSSPFTPHKDHWCSTEHVNATHDTRVFDLPISVSVDDYVSCLRIINSIVPVPGKQIIYVHREDRRIDVRAPGRKDKSMAIVSTRWWTEELVRHREARQVSPVMLDLAWVGVRVDPVVDRPAIIGLKLQGPTGIGIHCGIGLGTLSF